MPEEEVVSDEEVGAAGEVGETAARRVSWNGLVYRAR